MNYLQFVMLPILVFLLPNVDCSAIPMWEFLSRGEKMNHLFNMFVKQVADRCAKSTTPDCTKIMLVYGLTNLAKMDDQNLDHMDPYQRGASQIIWDHMMKDTPMESPSTKKSTDAQDYVDPYDSYSNENQLGSASSNIEELASPSNYIQGGPMVVRLLPDGSPVPEDANKPLPKDEDSEEYYSMRAKPIPSLEDVEKTKYVYAGNSRTDTPTRPGQQHFPATNRFRYAGY